MGPWLSLSLRPFFSCSTSSFTERQPGWKRFFQEDDFHSYTSVVIDRQQQPFFARGTPSFIRCRPIKQYLVLIENRVSHVQVLWLMGDRGLPKSYRHMNGYGSHTFSLINDKNERTWCKFHMKSEQGNESLTDEEGIALSGENPDLFNEDMFMVRSRNAGRILLLLSKSFMLTKRGGRVRASLFIKFRQTVFSIILFGRRCDIWFKAGCAS